MCVLLVTGALMMSIAVDTTYAANPTKCGTCGIFGMSVITQPVNQSVCTTV